MSYNLAFKKGNKLIDFPFQSSTKLTKAVLAATYIEDRLQLIEQQLELYGWEEEEISKVIDFIQDNLKDETITLVGI